MRFSREQIGKSSIYGNYGFTLFEIIIALILMSIFAVFFAHISDFSWNFSKSLKIVAIKERLGLIRSAIIQAAQDIDSDQFYEIYTSDSENSIPTVLNLDTMSKDDFGNRILYCAGPAHALNPIYATNSGIFEPSGVKAMIASAGKNEILESDCDSLSAQGDDIALTISESDIRYAKGGISGFKHQQGEMALISNNDNVNLQNSLVTIGHFSSLPLVDPNGSTIKSGTLGYDGQFIYVHDGAGQELSNWHKIGQDFPLRENICLKNDGNYGRVVASGMAGSSSGCVDTMYTSSYIEPGQTKVYSSGICGGVSSWFAQVAITYSCEGNYSSPPVSSPCVHEDGTYGIPTFSALAGMSCSCSQTGSVGPVQPQQSDVVLTSDASDCCGGGYTAGGRFYWACL